MNERLKSPFYKKREAVIGNAIVGFDGNGHCEGILRRIGEHLYDEPKPITQAILDEAAKQLAFFIVDDPKTKKVNEAQPYAKSSAKTSTRKQKVVAPKRTRNKEPETQPVEVDGKAVIDMPVDTASKPE